MKLNKRKPFKTITKGRLMMFGALLFVMGVATSVTSTIAYFNLTTVAVVSNLSLFFDVKDDSYLHLYLCKDERGYVDEDKSIYDLVSEGKLKLPGEDGFSPEELNIDGTVLTDVSGMDQSKWDQGKESWKTTLPTLPRIIKGNDKPVYNEKDKEHYVQNVFYLESNYDCTVYLDGSLNEFGEKSTFIAPDYMRNEETARNKDNIIADDLNDVVHAARVSFLTDEGYIIANPGEDEDTYYAGILDMDGNGYYDSYFDEVEGDEKEILYGEYTGKPEYTEPLSGDEGEEFKNVFISRHKQEVRKVILESVNRKKEEAVKLETLCFDPNTPKFEDELQPICTLKANERKRVVVTIYIEGWDKHMTDKINDAAFKIALGFTALLNLPNTGNN